MVRVKRLGLLLTALGPAVGSANNLKASESSNLIVSSPGDSAVIPGWSMQSVQHAPSNLTALSLPGANVNSWYHVSSRTTAMGGLIENNVYNDTTLWFSDNLNTIPDYSLFSTGWLYRQEFSVKPASGQHFFLKTNGITSKADIFVNGVQIANSTFQAGSYGGQRYDLTKLLKPGANCVLINAYPTNYLRDFAMGFVDWNPYPPDNGTGVWRNVELQQTGPVSMSPLRIVTDFTTVGASNVTVTVRADLTNYDSKTTTGILSGTVQTPDGTKIPISQSFKLNANEVQTVSATASIANPQIWWPAQWGDQPLYTASAEISANGKTSDVAATVKFGIRHVTWHLNAHNDTAFTVNGSPFLVLGGGFSPDMFMRWDSDRMRKIFSYMIDMGLNTLRLEGKQEQPELYEIADEMGVMIMPGWECCDKWEGWSYNDEADGVKWDDHDYWIANYSMLHEAEMMQTHPSVLAFLVGSDYWPDNRASGIYVDALTKMDWQNPIVASAGELGYPDNLPFSGMKMLGPYDWVPPNYWYGHKLGGGFGFGSELGSGVGTPEIGSLKKFLSEQDMEDLWKHPNKALFHMSSNVSSFYHRTRYNKALYARHGAPTSLDDYLLKAQLMDYEATRSEFEGFASRQSKPRPATGAIYWMLNGAWPNLHWQLFDYYLSPAGSYFGTKVGSRIEHVSYNYNESSVYIINRSLSQKGTRSISIDLINPHTGQSLSSKNASIQTTPNSSKHVTKLSGLDKVEDVALLRLILQDSSGSVLSRNVYWLTPTVDVLDWKNSTWYYTPVSTFVNYTSLNSLPAASLTATASSATQKVNGQTQATLTLENNSNTPAFFIRLVLVDAQTQEPVTPVYWSDNYVSLWPKEKLTLTVGVESGDLSGMAVQIDGKNVAATKVNL